LGRDQLVGLLISVASVAGIMVYGWLLFFTQWAILALQLTAFIAMAAVLGILAWIGSVLATTPPPQPIEEIEKELGQTELEEERKEEALGAR